MCGPEYYDVFYKLNEKALNNIKPDPLDVIAENSKIYNERLAAIEKQLSVANAEREKLRKELEDEIIRAEKSEKENTVISIISLIIAVLAIVIPLFF